ncbi:MAG: sulfatase [Phycisphaerae bacterium]
MAREQPRPPSRREFLTAGAFAAAAASPILRSSLLAGPQEPPKRKRAERYNIIFIMTDDQRWDAMSCMGHPFLETPNLDRLARDGALCQNAFVTTSLCSPSRASILTGLYAHRHEVLDNATLLPPGTPTYPRLLQAAGYETAFVGKWHMGGSSDEPRAGWDHWVSFRGQGRYFDPTFNINGNRQALKGYVTDLITDHAVDWLEARGRKPFCLAIGHKATHALFRPAPRHADKYVDAKVPQPMANTDENYKGLPAWVRAQRNSWHGVDDMYHGRLSWDKFYLDYHRALLAVDESLGRILDALARKGLLESTMLIFFSDNGFLHGEKGLIDKRCMYEPSIRVPLLVQCPGLVKPGLRVSEMILNIDLPSLFLAAAGLEPPETMQGASPLPLPRGEKIPWRKSWLYEYFFERSFPQTPTMFGVRTDDFKYIEYHGIWDKNELYHIAKDPQERNNLVEAPDYRARLDELRAELAKLRERYGARPNPSWRKRLGIR